MSALCQNCGSPNHYTHDCSKPPGSWTPPPAPARPAAKPAPQTVPEAEDAPQTPSGVGEQALDPPRWPGGPRMCPAANLPAFEDERERGRHETPGSKVLLKFRCRGCGLLHYYAGGHDPAGHSSGSTRTSLHHDELVGEAVHRFRHLISDPETLKLARRPPRRDFLRDATVADIERRKRSAAPVVELPAAAVSVAPEKPLDLPKRERPEPTKPKPRAKPAVPDPRQGGFL